MALTPVRSLSIAPAGDGARHASLLAAVAIVLLLVAVGGASLLRLLLVIGRPRGAGRA